MRGEKAGAAGQAWSVRSRGHMRPLTAAASTPSVMLRSRSLSTAVAPPVPLAAAAAAAPGAAGGSDQVRTAWRVASGAAAMSTEKVKLQAGAGSTQGPGQARGRVSSGAAGRGP
jgi:hypothetical protein